MPPNVPGDPLGPRGATAADPVSIGAHLEQARRSRRGLAGDTALALMGGLLVLAFAIGIGWRLVNAVL